MTSRRPWTWPWLIATATARGLLAVVVGLALWGAAPALLGWHPTTVSSGSMLPRLHVGDVAVSRPLGAQPPTLGSVLLFPDPDHPDRLRLHRFVAIDDDGQLITRGDANPGNDSSPVDPAAVLGVGTLRVPYLGLPVVWWREGSFVPLGLLVLVLIGLAALAAQAQRFTFDAPDDPSPPFGSSPPRPGGSAAASSELRDGEPSGVGPARRAARAMVAAAAALSLLAGFVVPSWSAFSGTTSTRADLSANPYFSCTNAINAAKSTLVLWYRLDETSSRATAATDSSGNGRTGTYTTAGKTAVRDGGCASADDTDRAMTFNGSSGALSSPAVSGAAPNTFSVAIRFKTTSSRGGKLIGYGSSRTGASAVFDRHLYLTNSGQVVFGVYPGAVRVVNSRSGFNDGEWHQAVGTLSSAGLRLYVDGELVDSDADTTSGEGRSGGYWRIAYDSLDNWPGSVSSDYFAGTLDDAVVSLVAPTAQQIQEQWLAGQPA